MNINRKIHLVQMISDLGANPLKMGAAKGPAAIIQFDRDRLKLFSENPELTIEAENTFIRKETNFLCAKYIDWIGKHQLNAINQVSELFKNHQFPLIFSGDHSNAASTVSALRNANPDKKIGLIWIDAHADLHTPYTTPSGNMHGMPVAILLGLDHISLDSNLKNPSAFELDWWNKLKNQNGTNKFTISSEDLFFIGIRDLEKEEWEIINQLNIQYIGPEKLAQIGTTELLNQLEKYFNDYDLLYVSFDIDSLDESLVPGTGTPVKNGLSINEASDLLSGLWKFPQLAALEVTEINPTIDENNITIPNVYSILNNILKNE